MLPELKLKTAEMLFLDHYYEKNLVVDTGKMHLAVIDEKLFIKALKEYNREIVKIIEDMIKEDRRKYFLNRRSLRSVKTRRLALTELKDKIRRK